MLKRKIVFILVVLLMAFNIPTMSFASESDVEESIEKQDTENVVKIEVSESELEPQTNENDKDEDNVQITEKTEVIDQTEVIEVDEEKNDSIEESIDEQSTEEESKDLKDNLDNDLVEEPIIETPIIEKPEAVEIENEVEEPIIEESLVLIENIQEGLATEVEEPKSILKIHHLFKSGEIVCDDYETIENLSEGDIVNFSKYSYEDEYEFANCINGDETLTIEAGENLITIKYTLKEGFKIV